MKTNAGTTSTVRRRRLAEGALLVPGAALTVAFAYALVREPVQGAAGLTLVAGAAAVLLLSRDIATVRIVAVVAALCLLLPLTALVGPVAAFPSFPQLFVFRVTLIALAGFGLLAVLMGHGRWQLRPQVWYAALDRKSVV